MKRRILFACLAIVLTFSLIGCAGENNLDGRWEAELPQGISILEFSGNRFTNTYIHFFDERTDGADSGTFTISGDQIELTYDDGHIVAHPFKRTENTITIGHTQFIRAR